MSTSPTPAMRQYLDAKQQHRDAILFFRMGDFFEIFYEDALVAARALELTLTSRSKDSNGGGIPMCGVPFHAVDGYIARLVKKGFRVAICDQVEDPRKAKGIVKREVTRVVSPGTFTDAAYLEAREPAFLAAIAQPAHEGGAYGLACLDVSTGDFAAAEFHGAAAAGAIVSYLRATQPGDLRHVRGIALRIAADALVIDPVTLKHLGILEGGDGGREGSLLDAVDRTITSMGGRLIRAWLMRPLVS